MTEYQNEGCSRGWMQQLEANVGRQKLDYMPKPAAGVMRMSEDDDGNAPKILRKVNLADSNGSLPTGALPTWRRCGQQDIIQVQLEEDGGGSSTYQEQHRLCLVSQVNCRPTA